MTENLNKTAWTIAITDFIDELDERHLQEYFKQVRLAVCYQTHLLTAKIDSNKSNDILQKIKNINVPLSMKDGKFNVALKELKVHYTIFVEKGWLCENQELNNKINELLLQYNQIHSIKIQMINKYQEYLLTAQYNAENDDNKETKKEFDKIIKNIKNIKKINIASLIKEDKKYNEKLQELQSLCQKFIEKCWLSNNQEVIVELNELNDRFNKTKSVKQDLIKCYCDYLLTAKFLGTDKDDKKEFDSTLKYIKKLDAIKLSQENNEREFGLLKINNSLKELKDFYQDFTQKGYLSDISTQIQAIEQENNFYKLWIYHLLLVADGVSIGTHIAKLTHSSSSASSLVDEINETQNGVLSTSTLKNPIYDGTYLSGAAMSKYAKFYLLNIGNQPLGLLLKQGDFSPLSELFSDDELERIKQDFHRLLNPDLQADSLAKQVYFPLDIYYPEYHQLVILQSSSLAQEIHQRFFEKKVRAEREKIEKYKNDGKYHSEILASPPKTLLFANVASQPQNVSVFLGSRGGGTRLFDGSAPIWQRQNNPPIHHKSLFSDGLLNARAKDNIAVLQEKLITFETANISFKNPKCLKGVLYWLNAVIDDVLDYVGEMAQFKAGWSNTDECKLPISHQVLLDFNRNDDQFTIAKNGDWQAVVVNDFVVWLNQKLYDEEKAFSVNDEHGRVWRDEFADKLREYVELLEISSTQKGAK